MMTINTRRTRKRRSGRRLSRLTVSRPLELRGRAHMCRLVRRTQFPFLTLLFPMYLTNLLCLNLGKLLWKLDPDLELSMMTRLPSNQCPCSVAPTFLNKEYRSPAPLSTSYRPSSTWGFQCPLPLPPPITPAVAGCRAVWWPVAVLCVWGQGGCTRDCEYYAALFKH